MACEGTQVCPKYMNILCLCGFPSAVFKLQCIQILGDCCSPWRNPGVHFLMEKYVKFRQGRAHGSYDLFPERKIMLQHISLSPYLYSFYCNRFLLQTRYSTYSDRMRVPVQGCWWAEPHCLLQLCSVWPLLLLCCCSLLPILFLSQVLLLLIRNTNTLPR